MLPLLKIQWETEQGWSLPSQNFRAQEVLERKEQAPNKVTVVFFFNPPDITIFNVDVNNIENWKYFY